MTIQEAAHDILNELGKPVSSKELSRIALDRRMVTSVAKDPVQSHAQTIEKNIRDDIYNQPKLIFVHGPKGRLIGLPGWESKPPKEATNAQSILIELKVRIPVELLEKIRLADQAKLKNNFDETVTLILSKGLASLAPEIKKGLMQQLDSLETFNVADRTSS